MKIFSISHKPKHPAVDPAELARLRQVEQLAAKMAELLEDGKVDYDLLKELKALLNPTEGAA